MTSHPIFPSSSAVPTLQSFPSKLRVCLVGLGRAGNFHMSCISRSFDQVELTWAVDIQPAAVEGVCKLFGCKGAASLEEAMEHKDEFDIVIVASTTNQHYGHIMTGLSGGKAVFTEKPISHDPQEIKQVLDKVRAVQVPFMVGFQRRFDASFAGLKAQMQRGHVGDARVIRCTSRDNPEPPLPYLKVSGGIFHDMLCHDFDMLHFLTGQIPSTIYSVGHCYNPEIAKFDDVDTAMVTFQYDSGLIASVDTSRIAAYGYDQRVEVFGETGMAQCRNLEQAAVTLATVDGFTTPPASHSFPQRYPQAYLSQFLEWLRRVREAELPSEAELAWLVALEAVTTGAELSWRLKRPVQLSEVDSLRSHLPH